MPCAIAQSSGARRPAGKSPATSEAAFNDLTKRAAEAASGGRLEEALSLYRQALELRPKWAEGWWAMGTILYERDLYAPGRDAFRALTSLEPKHGPGWGMLGLCEFNTREYERAIVSLQRGRALGLGGNAQLESVVRYHAAIVYNRMEQFEIAYEILREFVREGNESAKVIEAFGHGDVAASISSERNASGQARASVACRTCRAQHGRTQARRGTPGV